MGLLLFACSWSPSFGIGVTLAVFHFNGNTLVKKVALTIDLIAWTIGLRVLDDMNWNFGYPRGVIWRHRYVIVRSICL